MNVKMELPDLEAVVKDVVDEAVKGLYRGAVLIQGEAVGIVRKERFATGHLSQSIHAEVLPPDGDNLQATVSATAPYAPFVEYDTRPHVAPFQPFVLWARTKRGRGANVTAFAGWQAVRKRGTKGIHFFRRAMEAKGNAAAEEVANSIRKALSKYAR